MALAICTFFATTFDTAHAPKELIPTLQNQVDFLHPLPEVQKSLHEVGFRNIRVSSIGKNVWPGFDRWISQGEFKSSWDRNWYQGDKKGLFDYFLIVACK